MPTRSCILVAAYLSISLTRSSGHELEYSLTPVLLYFYDLPENKPNGCSKNEKMTTTKKLICLSCESSAFRCSYSLTTVHHKHNAWRLHFGSFSCINCFVLWWRPFAWLKCNNSIETFPLARFFNLFIEEVCFRQ